MFHQNLGLDRLEVELTDNELLEDKVSDTGDIHGQR
jgi:hypothetical protein